MKKEKPTMHFNRKLTQRKTKLSIRWKIRIHAIYVIKVRLNIEIVTVKKTEWRILVPETCEIS